LLRVAGVIRRPLSGGVGDVVDTRNASEKKKTVSDRLSKTTPVVFVTRRVIFITRRYTHTRSRTRVVARGVCVYGDKFVFCFFFWDIRQIRPEPCFVNGA